MTLKTSCIIFLLLLNKNSRYSELYTKLYNMFTIKRSFITVNIRYSEQNLRNREVHCNEL